MRQILLVVFVIVIGVAAVFLLKPKAEEHLELPVVLYYYDASRDLDSAGNVMCSKQGLVPVARTIPEGDYFIEDTIRLLIQGDLTREEKARGITTEFPLEEFSFADATINEGVLTLSFNDPKRHSSGGACRASILWYQVEATAEQFPQVREVRFSPGDLFQP